MPRRIHVLPDRVANQIAAGEVVERPASVVKELVENALDAHARRIDVRIERGGKRLIRVSDDGEGMSREDALLSLDRHATSKIAEADDLRSVRSFGFRGEALPSIAAVGRVRIETREAEEEVGAAVRVTGGTITAVEECARRRGTTVEVRDLFFNAPARARFLRAVSAEARAVSETMTVLALAHPGVALSLQSDDRVLLELPARADVPARIADLWGDEEAAALVPVAFEGHGLTVRGLAQRPDAARPGVRRGHLFVNGRPFRDPALLKAADRGYRTTIPPGARPWIFLWLDAADGSVDVNVHPAKEEVRFRDAAGVADLVEAAVRRAMAAEESAATLDATPPAAAAPARVREGGAAAAAPPGEDQMALFLSGAPGPARTDGADADAGDAPVLAERPRLFQLHRTYILAETREGLLIIDQHSAHERILYERLMSAFGADGQPGQRLLFPLTVRLGAPELEEVQEVEGLLSRAGFEVEAFGGDTVIVQAVPDPHPWFDAERCFREMVAELASGSDLTRSAKNQHERIAMTFACKGAIKAGQHLTEPEMQELFDALFATELPYHDVHGRPTVVRLSAGELERKFNR